jgi:signal transduction histidine kinase
MHQDASSSDGIAWIVGRLRRVIAGGRHALRRPDGAAFHRPVAPVLLRCPQYPSDGMASKLPPSASRTHTQAHNREIARARLDERARLARDLHDQTGQQISTLKLGLYNLRERAASAIQAEILQIENLVDELARDLYRVVADLQPVGIEEFGLVPVLRNMAEEWSAATSVAARLQVLGCNPRPGLDIEVALFYVAKECLNNVHKHALTASKVNIELEYTEKLITLTIDDDGRGLSNRVPTRSGCGFGLEGMAERAAILGGQVEVGAAPSGGTRVRVRIPVGSRPI